MDNQFTRTRILLGDEAMQILKNSRVAVFGVGGVGGYVTEALARSGVGAFDLIDRDQVSITNLNRQIIATMKTIGMDKTQAMADRIRDINPEAEVTQHKCFYLPETADMFDFTLYDYVVDAVDTVTAKIEIILQAQRAGVPVISSMGAGNKLDPSKFEVADIYKTSVDPLARVMRRELKKRGVKKLKVVYSKEEPLKPLGRIEADPEAGRKDVPGSSAFTPSAAGLLIASEVVRDLIRFERHGRIAGSHGSGNDSHGSGNDSQGSGNDGHGRSSEAGLADLTSDRKDRNE